MAYSSVLQFFSACCLGNFFIFPDIQLDIRTVSGLLDLWPDSKSWSIMSKLVPPKLVQGAENWSPGPILAAKVGPPCQKIVPMQNWKFTTSACMHIDNIRSYVYKPEWLHAKLQSGNIYKANWKCIAGRTGFGCQNWSSLPTIVPMQNWKFTPSTFMLIDNIRSYTYISLQNSMQNCNQGVYIKRIS